jgi:hypothetical protein
LKVNNIYIKIGVEFKWQRSQELIKEHDKREVTGSLEVKGEEELKDN